MTAKQLIEELQKLPPETQINIYEDSSFYSVAPAQILRPISQHEDRAISPETLPGAFVLSRYQSKPKS